MLVRFWGTRGSLPTPLNAAQVRKKIEHALLESVGHDLTTPTMVDKFIDEHMDFAASATFGGNTSCVEIDDIGEDYFICDLGTGIREFGQSLLTAPRRNRKNIFHIFMSHVHWDHIMGFPLFTQAYTPGNTIKIYGCHANMESAFRRQHGAPSFPVEFDMLGAEIEFIQLQPDQSHDIAGLRVCPFVQHHAGDSYGYRFERDGHSVVYSTDCEHKHEQIHEDYPFVENFRDVDVLIFDAMYSLAETVSVKEDWGHSSNIIAVELALMANAKRLYLFHHEPANNDANLLQVLMETRRYADLIAGPQQSLEVFSAYDGLEVRL